MAVDMHPAPTVAKGVAFVPADVLDSYAINATIGQVIRKYRSPYSALPCPEITC